MTSFSPRVRQGMQKEWWHITNDCNSSYFQSRPIFKFSLFSKSGFFQIRSNSKVGLISNLVCYQNRAAFKFSLFSKVGLLFNTMNGNPSSYSPQLSLSSDRGIHKKRQVKSFCCELNFQNTISRPETCRQIKVKAVSKYNEQIVWRECQTQHRKTTNSFANIIGLISF